MSSSSSRPTVTMSSPIPHAAARLRRAGDSHHPDRRRVLIVPRLGRGRDPPPAAVGRRGAGLGGRAGARSRRKAPKERSEQVERAGSPGLHCAVNRGDHRHLPRRARLDAARHRSWSPSPRRHFHPRRARRPRRPPSPRLRPLPPPAAGPRLSSEPYASFAYQVWPNPLDTFEQLAMSGWTLAVSRQSGGITVQALQDGTAMASVSRFSPGGAGCTSSTPTSATTSPAAPTSTTPTTASWSRTAQGQVLP